MRHWDSAGWVYATNTRALHSNIKSQAGLFASKEEAENHAPSWTAYKIVRVIRKPRRITREEFLTANKALDLQMLREHTHEYATTAGLRAALATLGIEVDD